MSMFLVSTVQARDLGICLVFSSLGNNSRKNEWNNKVPITEHHAMKAYWEVKV